MFNRFSVDQRICFRDVAFILCIVTASSSAYVGGLGYYSDDFIFLDAMASSADQSWGGLYKAIAHSPFAAVRPGQILWYVAFHKLASDNETAVHMANHIVFAASAVLMFVSLRASSMTRSAAYYITVIYISVPTFSVAKMWYANHQAVLSLAMFMLVWLLTTKVAKSKGSKHWPLMGAILIAAIAGNLCYELFWVIAIGLPLFVWISLGHSWRDLVRNRAFLATVGTLVFAFGLAAIFKLTKGYGFELPDAPSEIRPFVARSIRLYLGAVHTTFWTLGAWSPRAAIGFLNSSYLQSGTLLAPIVVLLILVTRELLAARKDQGWNGRLASSRLLLVSGICAFGLGYVPYLTNFLHSNYPWGEGNRGNIAASIGAAMIFYVAFRSLFERHPNVARGTLIAFCSIGIFLQVAVARMWVAAVPLQERMQLQFERTVAGRLHDGDAVLLYSTCPYFGAAPVFPYGWDLARRRALEGGRTKLAIDIVMPEMQILHEGIATPPNRWTKLYPYQSLYLLDMDKGTLEGIANLRETRSFFEKHPLDRAITCQFRYGIGNPIY